MVTIRPMLSEDTLEAAAIHIEGQPHTFLSSLGRSFVARVFAYTVRSPCGFGFVAVEGDDVVGFAVCTESNARLFSDVLPRHFLALALALVPHVLRHPSVLAKAIETLRYPAAVRELPGELESLSRGVRHDWQGKGVGSLLWAAVVAEAQRRGATHIVMTVDAAHGVINAWHRARNHEVVRNFPMYGRTMIVYRVAVEPPLAHDVGQSG